MNSRADKSKKQEFVVLDEEQEFAESKNAGNGEKGNTAPGQQADQQLDMGFMDIPDGEQNDLPFS